eukprot:gene32051-36183_t
MDKSIRLDEINRFSKGSGTNNNVPASAVKPGANRNLSEEPVGTHTTERKQRLRPVPKLTRDTIRQSIRTENTQRNPRLRPGPMDRPNRVNLHDEFSFGGVQEPSNVDRRKVVRPLLNRVSTVSVSPVIAILVANVVGLAVNLLSPLNYKNYLKAIVAANVLREWTEAVYNIFMLFFASSDSDKPMGEYLGRIFMNIWWN